MSAVDDVTKTVREAAYVAVGFGVLGFQQAQVRRRQLASHLEEQRPSLEAQLAETRTQLVEAARQVEQRLEPVMNETRKAAREGQEQLRAWRDQPGSP